MSEKSVLVTGGSGYVSAQVVKLLQETGYQVRTTVRDAHNEAKVKHLKDLCPGAAFPLEVVEADLLHEDSWPRAVKGCRYVVHVASPFPLKAPANEDDLIKPAVSGTLNVLKACAEAGTVKRVVLTSSVTATMDVTVIKGGKTYSEADWRDLNNEASAYARSKTLAENTAWNYVDELPLEGKFELSVVNPSLVLGPVHNSTPGSSTEVLSMFLARSYPALPPMHFGVCDVRDVARAHLECMTRPEAAGHRHIVNTASFQMKEIAEVLHKEFAPQGYKVPTWVIPGWTLPFLSLFSSDLKEARKFCQPYSFDNGRMTRVLGITPTPMATTVVDMAYSMIEKGMLPRTHGYTGPSSH